MKTYRIFRIGMHCALVACVLATMLAVAWGQTSGEQVAAGLRQPLKLSAAVEDANGNVNLSWVENNTCMSGYSIEPRSLAAPPSLPSARAARIRPVSPTRTLKPASTSTACERCLTPSKGRRAARFR